MRIVPTYRPKNNTTRASFGATTALARTRNSRVPRRIVQDPPTPFLPSVPTLDRSG
jgi:hypothetical protein